MDIKKNRIFLDIYLILTYNPIEEDKKGDECVKRKSSQNNYYYCRACDANARCFSRI